MTYSKHVPGADVKLAVRADRPAGVIRAWICNFDETETILELSTLSVRAADIDPKLFDSWLGALSSHLHDLVEDITGLDVKMVRQDPPYPPGGDA